MPDTRPRNAEGQFSPETGGGANPGSFQAAYNPAIIMQNNESRQAILAAVNKRKQMTQPQRGVEGTEPSGPSDTMLSRKEFARGDVFLRSLGKWAKKQKADVRNLTTQSFLMPGVHEALRKDVEGYATATGMPLAHSHKLVPQLRDQAAKQIKDDRHSGLLKAQGLDMKGLFKHRYGSERAFSFLGRLTELSAQCQEFAGS